MSKRFRMFGAIIVAVVSMSALVSAHDDHPHGPVPQQPAAMMCDTRRCHFEATEIIDGFRFTNSRTPGEHGSVGWWEGDAFLPFNTDFWVSQCVGTIPFEDTDCGPIAHGYVSMPTSVPEVIRYFFPEQYQRASDIARCESGHNPRAMSPDGSNHGLFQINNVHRRSFERVTGKPWSDVYVAFWNAKFARWLYDSQGWGPWACS